MRAPEQIVRMEVPRLCRSRCGPVFCCLYGWDVFYSAQLSIQKVNREPAAACGGRTPDCGRDALVVARVFDFLMRRPFRALPGPDSRYHAKDAILSSRPVDFFSSRGTIDG